MTNDLLLILAIATFNPGAGDFILTTNTLLILILFCICRPLCPPIGCPTVNLPCPGINSPIGGFGTRVFI